MAPLRSKMRKSTDSTSTTTSHAGIQKSSPLMTRTIVTKAGNPVAQTPKRSPLKRKVTLTAAQKQALIDNLQLEVTERARKLRAQYSLQVQGLKTRLEIRVNRIPMALRKANIGELLAKYTAEEAAAAPFEAEANKTRQTAADEIAARLHAPKGAGKDIDSRENYPTRGKKRLSDEISCDADKENDSHQNLTLPKKRTKTAAPATGVPARTASRAKPTTISQVLSPKSSNATNAMSKNMQRPAPRTQTTPGKSLLARPVPTSPPKPTIPSNSSAAAPTAAATGVLAGMVEKLKSTRSAAARKISPIRAPTAARAKRVPAQPVVTPKRVGRTRTESNGSHSSGSTTGTVVMKLKPKGNKVAAAVQKVEREVRAKAAPVGRTTAAAAKKVAASKAAVAASTVVAPAPAEGKRVLRKRK